MFISCQSRECDLLEFFHNENQSFPAALSDGGKLHSGPKSLLVSNLEAKIAVLDARPEASAIIVDESALTNALSPHASKTFEEYINKDVIPTVEAFLAEIFGLPLVKERTSDGNQYTTVVSSTPVLDVMLCRLSVEKVKVQHNKCGMFILKLQWYLPTPQRIHQ